MIDAKTILLDQLSANANDPSWYILFSEAIDALSEAEAFWKPDNSSHSIAEIVQHLIYWNETWQLWYRQNQVNPDSQTIIMPILFLLGMRILSLS